MAVEISEYKPRIIDRLQDYWHDHKHATIISGITSVVLAGSGLVAENVMSGVPAHLVSGYLEVNALLFAAVCGKTFMELEDDYSNPGSRHYILPQSEETVAQV